MFDRFSGHARETMSHARQEALRLGHDSIGTEHLLLGIVRWGGGNAARALKELGREPWTVRDAVERLVTRGTSTNMGQLPFTPGAKRTLELSLEEAQTLRHDYIGTEHVLLGLLREGEGIAATALVRDLGLDVDRVRAKILELVAADPDADRPPLPASPGTHAYRSLRHLGWLGLLGLLGFVDVRLGYLGFLGFLGFLGATAPDRK